MNVHWPFVFVTSIGLYALMLLTLPFNPQMSSVFLFALIAYWSRIPGVGIPTPMFILYQMDLVDLFSMIIAINIGGPTGAAFAIFGNVASRAAGIFPSWAGVINDAASQGVICLFMPIIHGITQNIFVSMMIFTIIRRLGFIVGHFVYPQFSSFIYYIIVVWPGSTFVSLTINGFYGKYFGNYFNGLMMAGVKFNWSLFLIATFLIVVMWRLMVGKRSSKLMQKGALARLILGRLRINKKMVENKNEKNNENIMSDEGLLLEVKRQFNQMEGSE